MTLPRYLLRAIVRDVPEDDRLRGAREWERRLPEMQAAADRIRGQAASSSCLCEYPAPGRDGRCTRCWGVVA